MDNYQKHLRKYKLINVRGVLLDFDGTIVPSEKVFLRTWQEVFLDKYCCDFTEEEYIKYELEKDTKLIDFLVESNRLSKDINRLNLMQDIYAAYEAEFQKMLEKEDFSCVLTHIAQWQQSGIKLGIVSTSRRSYINLFFEHYSDYKEIFSCVLCREDVTKLKPDPMVYLLAIDNLGILKSQCLVIEDSPKGIKGAIAAKMNVVRVMENTLSGSDIGINDIDTVNSITDIEA